MLTFVLSLPRKVRNRYAKYRLLHHREQRIRREVEQTPPVPVGSVGGAQVRMLCSHDRLADGIATLKSFFRYPAARYPLFFHDDGTMTQADLARIERHFPGAQVVLRADADPVLEAELRRRKLPRCIELRRMQPHQLKLFDFAYYARGTPFLQLDSDVLFFDEPREIIDALAVPPGPAWWDCFNLDAQFSYTWDDQQIRNALGFSIVPLCNVGVMCLHRSDDLFEFLELCLERLPRDRWHPYFLEQTLTALYSSRNGRARPLDPRYDVMGRFSRQATGVVAEHYCGTLRYLFYDHFSERVLPDLMHRAHARGAHQEATR